MSIKTLKIDGQEFSVLIKNITRNAVIKYKVDAETEDGGRYSEPLGTFVNYEQIEFGIIRDIDAYNRLFDALISPVSYHEIEMPINGDYTKFQGQVYNVTDNVDKTFENGTRFKSLICSIRPISPTIRG